MLLKLVAFASLVLAALSLAPAAAHALEVRGKMILARDDYRVVQRLYRGWALVGILIVAELLALLALTVLVRDRLDLFVPAALALACVTAAQFVFWSRTFPVNAKTHDWTRLPDDWEALRRRWERSHVVAAALNLVAFVALAALLASRFAA